MNETYTTCFEYEGRRYCLTFYQPRPYQKEAVEAWLKAGRYGAVQLPTGAGKTFVALYAWEALGFPKMVIVVPTKALRNSHINALTKIGVPPELITEDPRKKDGLIAIITYALITRYPWLFRELRDRGYRFWVFDESHHIAAQRFFEEVFEPQIHNKGEDRGVAVLGLSATPHSSGYYVERLKQFLPIVYRRTYEQLKDYLAPMELYLVATPLRADKLEEYEEIENKLRKLRQELLDRYQTLNMSILSRYTDRDPAVQSYFMLFNKKKAILNFVQNKDEAIARILNAYPNERAMIFSERQDQLLKVMKDLKDKYGIKGFPFVNKTVRSKKQEKAVLDAFREGKFRVLGIVKKGEEGVDFPDVSIGIIVSTPKNERTIVQRVGRVIRKKPGKVAKIFYLYAPGTEEEEVAKRFIRLLNPSKVYWITMDEIGKATTPTHIRVRPTQAKVLRNPKEKLLAKVTARLGLMRKALRSLKARKAELEKTNVRKGDLLAWTGHAKELAELDKKIRATERAIEILTALQNYLSGAIDEEELMRVWRRLSVDGREIEAAVGEKVKDTVPMPIRLVDRKKLQSGLDSWLR